MCELTEAPLPNPICCKGASQLFCSGSPLIRWSVLSYLGNTLPEVKHNYRSLSGMKLPRWLTKG